MENEAKNINISNNHAYQTNQKSFIDPEKEKYNLKCIL